MKWIIWVLIICIIILFTPVVDDIYGVYAFKRGIQIFFSNMFNSLSKPSCPQINVSLKDTAYGIALASDKYDGWEIHSNIGGVTCRKGSKEGENVNYYYCGGFQSIIGLISINAYVEKTEISSQGNVEKTRKYVIWNTYDENKNFISTKCLGNPDEIEKRQAEDFIQAMKSFS